MRAHGSKNIYTYENWSTKIICLHTSHQYYIQFHRPYMKRIYKSSISIANFMENMQQIENLKRKLYNTIMYSILFDIDTRYMSCGYENIQKINLNKVSSNTEKCFVLLYEYIIISIFYIIEIGIFKFPRQIHTFCWKFNFI